MPIVARRFIAGNDGQEKAICDWVLTHKAQIAEAAESTTSHGQLTGITTTIGGTSVFVRMEFDTKDAMA